jgi:hypothetical protein
MWAKRIGAILLAAILIGGAVLLRRAVTGGSDAPTTEPPASATAVTCIPELESACRALAAGDPGIQVTIEPAGATYERVVADPSSAPAAWITAPWPAMVSSAVAVNGGTEPALPDRPRRRWHAPMVAMVGLAARCGALTQHCGTPQLALRR